MDSWAALSAEATAHPQMDCLNCPRSHRGVATPPNPTALNKREIPRQKNSLGTPKKQEHRARQQSLRTRLGQLHQAMQTQTSPQTENEKRIAAISDSSTRARQRGCSQFCNHFNRVNPSSNDTFLRYHSGRSSR